MTKRQLEVLQEYRSRIEYEYDLDENTSLEEREAISEAIKQLKRKPPIIMTKPEDIDRLKKILSWCFDDYCDEFYTWDIDTKDSLGKAIDDLERITCYEHLL